MGILPSVLYSPKDAALITGTPQERRRFLNLQIAQTDPLYVHHLMRYHKAMKHRNSLLKQKSLEAIEPWEQMMVVSALYLMKKRSEATAMIKKYLIPIVHELSHKQDVFDLCYSPSLSLKKDETSLLTHYVKMRKKDLIMGATLHGPHRDELIINYHEKEAKHYASEGQKRTCIAALKMAEWHHLAEMTQEIPLMSIDDFGIHLDERRLKLLTDKLNVFHQVFLTTPLTKAPLSSVTYIKKL